MCTYTLQWRYNSRRDGVSTVYSGSASLVFMRGISPQKWPVTRKMFPFDDAIMYACVICSCVLLRNAAPNIWHNMFYNAGGVKLVDKMLKNTYLEEIIDVMNLSWDQRNNDVIWTKLDPSFTILWILKMLLLFLLRLLLLALGYSTSYFSRQSLQSAVNNNILHGITIGERRDKTTNIDVTCLHNAIHYIRKVQSLRILHISYQQGNIQWMC